MAHGYVKDGAIHLDVSEFRGVIDQLKFAVGEEKAEGVLREVVRETGRQVKPILKKDLPEEYYVKPGWIGSATKRPIMGGAGSISCVIPLKGAKLAIGGKHIPAVGGIFGWPPGKYQIFARILADKMSALPDKMTDRGGKPPFRNLNANRLNNVAYTREKVTDKRGLPIKSISALAVPQMPLNQSEEDVTESLYQEFEKQLTARMENLLP